VTAMIVHKSIVSCWPRECWQNGRDINAGSIVYSARKLGTLFGVAMTVLAMTAHADIVSVAGSTSGAFFDGATNDGTSVGHLTFTGGSFGPINSDQTLTLSLLNGINLHNGTDNYDPYTFDLTVAFTTPAGISSATIIADVTGSAHGNGGLVTFDFPTIPTHFTFGNGGSFDLTVADLTVDLDIDSGDGTLHGTLSNVTASQAAVPEPSSVLLLLTAMGCVCFSLRRRTLKVG
jgi:hypothetical protein